MRLFELLSAYKDTGIWECEIQKFAELMDYKFKKKVSYSDMLRDCLKKPLEELKGTDLEFTYDKVFAPKIIGKKGRRPIGAVRFTLKKKKITAIPKKWYESEELTEVINQLINTWQVSELNIARYSKSIGIEKLKNLIKSWEKTQNSTVKRIDNKLAYCNSVFVKIGKEALDKKQI